MKRGRGVAVGVALLLSACSHTEWVVSLKPPPQQPRAADYVDELKLWSRHCHIISDFDEALTADATMHAPEFQDAFAAKWIDLYRLSTDDAAKKRAQLVSEIADVWEFHLETQTHFYTINDFTQGRGIWRVTLVDDRGRALTPADARQTLLKREVDVALYPYAGIFTTGWRLRFSRALPDGQPFVDEQTRWIALRIAGPPGSCDLKWLLR